MLCFLAGLAKGDVLFRHRRKIGLEPRGHVLLFFEILLQRRDGLGFPRSLSQDDERVVCCDFVILEGEVGERVLEDFVASCELSVGCSFGAVRGDWSYHTAGIQERPE